MEEVDERVTFKVAEAIERVIVDGTFQPHAQMTSERELARRYGVKRHIIRRAMLSLEDKGLLYRRERGGTFVRYGADGHPPYPHELTLKGVNFIEHNWPYVPEFLQGVLLQGYSRVLEHHSLRVRFLLEPAGPEAYESLLMPALPPEAQGCVLGNFLKPDLMEWLSARRVPFVVRMGRVYDRDALPPHHGVYVNRGHAGFQATNHLLALGHRRIGFAGWLPGQQTEMMYDGYQAALSLAGVRPNPQHLVRVSGITPEESLQAVLPMLRHADRPTAIVAQNDLAAIGIIRAAEQAGLTVPEDLSVTGYDDHPAARGLQPPLTTFHNPIEELAATTLSLLAEVATGRAAGWQHRTIEPRMVMRASMARPKEPGSAVSR